MMPQYPKYKTFPKPVIDCSEDLKNGGHAVQADAAEVNINNIIKRIEKGGAMPEVNGQPFYGDVSEFNGLADSIEKIQTANKLFMSYPADLRSRFDNDPVKMVEFLENPNNLKEAVELGLAIRPPETEAPPAVIPPVA